MTGWALTIALGVALLYAVRRSGRAEAEVSRLKRELANERKMRAALGEAALVDDDAVIDHLLDRVRKADGQLPTGQSSRGDD